MINILFIHQSAELYGSDKTLLLLLKNLDKNKFSAVVVLPFDGPLKKEIEKENIKVVIAPVLKLYRKMFSPANLFNFFNEIKKGVEILDELNHQYKFDLVYSNTLAVLLGIIYAKKRKIKHLWHVHEIIESPKVFTKLFCKILQIKSNTSIVYNSIATQNFWNVNTKIASKAIVIWNGLELPKETTSPIEITVIREHYFNSDTNDIIVALVGRISRWKGQLTLLDAFKKTLETHQNIKLVFIGSSPPNQDNFLEKLNQKINEYQISNKVTLIPFQENIFKFWQSIDIAVVPSTEPEPFGLVAVEAMLAKKPVIGSNHGGLKEIILDNETGFLITPNNEIALSNALQKLIENKELRQKFGANGFERAIQEFSAEGYVQKFEKLFADMLKSNKIYS